MSRLIATNPFTAKVIEQYPALNAEQVSERIGDARSAFAQWSATSIAERAEVLRAVAKKMRENKQHLAELMALEMGKPIKEGEAEVEKAAGCAEHYAEHAPAYLTPQTLPSDASHSYIDYQPLGTLLGILPWNAPVWLAFRYLVPALMAGNTCVIKHDPNVPACAQAIVDAFAVPGAPTNIVVNLPITTPQIEAAIRDPRIVGVSFTGSATAGRKVAAIAGSEIKPVVLELGGSDPCIVMADADLDKAADIATLSRIINAGQSCIAAKRIIVEASIYEDFIDRLHQRLAKLTLGDPLQRSTDIGPLARADLRDNLARQVSQTLEAGARCVFQSEVPAGDGFFYPVTLLADVSPDMCAFREETFGPVMVVTAADNIDHALQLANDTDYGLGAAIWSSNQAHIQRAINELQAGQVAVNGIVKTDSRLPSGGIKGSGLGRELGPQGILEFVNAKQVWIK
jgi:succinate-semialdehyde dehydrogenase/glutarate-semialdehyde dehydrogenase